MNPNPKKILVVSLDNLGDTLMATGIFPVLRSFQPQAKIGFWVKNYCAGLFESYPLIDTLHASDPFWDTSPGHGKGSFWQFISTVKDIRKMKYDTALVLNAEWRRAAFCFLAGIPERVGFDRRKSRFFLNETFRPLSPLPHVVEEHRALLDFWLKTNVAPALCQPAMFVSPEQQRWAKNWRETEGLIHKQFVFIHPFTGNPLRNWPLPFYLEFMESLHKQKPDLRFVVSCGRGDERALEEVLPKMNELKVVRLINRPLQEVKAVLAEARMLVAADTGLAHLAGALGVPEVCMFGPTNPGRFRPRGPGNVKIIHHNPLAEIKPADVLRAALEMWDRS